MPEWRAWVAETITGLVVADVVLAENPQFERAINDKGSWTVALHIDERLNRRDDFVTYVRPAWYSWIVAYDDRPIQAGPVWTHGFNEEDRKLTVSGSGMAGMMDRRVVRRAGGMPHKITDPSNDLAYRNLSLPGIMRALVADNLAQDGYGLPIDLPSPESGTAERNYYGYSLAMMWDRMSELAEVINGPEFDLAPVFINNGTAMRWQLRVGGPYLGDAESPAVWDYGGALSHIDVDVNGSAAPITRSYVKGSGEDAAMLTGYAQNDAAIAAGYPGMDHVDSDHTSVVEPPTLAAYAQQNIRELAAAEETWSCTVRLDGLRTRGIEVSPGVGSWNLGDSPIFGVSGHPWIADGDYRRRILGYAQDETATVKLTLGSTPHTT